MSLYPSIEALTMDNMAQAQASFVQNTQSAVAASHRNPQLQAAAPPAYAPAPYASAPYTPASAPTLPRSLYGGLYADLGLDDYMGISLALAQQQNPYLQAAPQPQPQQQDKQHLALGAPSSSSSSSAAASSAVVPRAQPGAVVLPNASQQAILGYKRAEVKNGVRPVVLAKDGTGKFGIAVQAINKGVFVSCVWRNSAAALAGVRVGDQLLQIDHEAVAGFSAEKVIKTLLKARADRVELVFRDRPFERTITLTKNSTEHLGFVFKKGKITQIAKDTSAARNGLLTEHHFLEINGVNVIGLDDDAIQREIAAAGDVVTLTVMPSFIFETMLKNITSTVVRKYMDHSVPDV